jgi:hypothetical protein
MPLAEKLDDLDREHPVVVTEWGFAAGSKNRHRQVNEPNVELAS